MDIQEKAKVIAMAKLLGCTLPNAEILEKYSQYHQEALGELQKDSEPGKTVIFKRPF